jgi:hypothetical protein
MTKTYVAISDMQIPYHDPKAVQAVVDFIAKEKPDGLLCVGDELDAPQPSRWERGMAGEYADTLLRDIDQCARIMAEFRAALGRNKPFHVVRSNHGDRIATYVGKYAPALAPFIKTKGLLDIPSLLRYDDIGVTYHRRPYEFARGWMLAHGDEGSMSRIAGCTAKNLGVVWGKSVVCGHTHRAGIVPHTIGLAGSTRTIYGVEVGNLMDMKKADYLKASTANWQQAFGVIRIDEKDWRKSSADLRYIVKGQVAGV